MTFFIKPENTEVLLTHADVFRIRNWHHRQGGQQTTTTNVSYKILATLIMNRAARKQDAEKAYEVQVKAGTQGAIRYASIGTGLVILGHYTWPLFRRQTLAFKAFLVTGFAFFGLSIYAEHALQSLEAEQRYSESIIRKEARIELARRGQVPTETAIAQWKAERLERMKAAENQAQTGTESSPES